MRVNDTIVGVTIGLLGVGVIAAAEAWGLHENAAFLLGAGVLIALFVLRWMLGPRS